MLTAQRKGNKYRSDQHQRAPMKIKAHWATGRRGRNSSLQDAWMNAETKTSYIESANSHRQYRSTRNYQDSGGVFLKITLIMKYCMIRKSAKAPTMRYNTVWLYRCSNISCIRKGFGWETNGTATKHEKLEQGERYYSWWHKRQRVRLGLRIHYERRTAENMGNIERMGYDII